MSRKPKAEPQGGVIPASEIVIVYQQEFRMNWLRKAWSLVDGTFKLADEYYQPADRDIIMSVVAQDLTDKVEYREVDFDCDDSAFSLMGALHKDLRTACMPIFITWVEYYEDGKRYGHAVVSFYEEGRVYIIEPQNDNLFLVPEYYRLNMICG